MRSNINLLIVLIPSFPLVAWQLPLIHINDAVYNSWTQGDLTRVEELLTEELEHTLYRSRPRVLANRALVRTRLKRWDMAVDDAKKVLSCHLFVFSC